MRVMMIFKLKNDFLKAGLFILNQQLSLAFFIGKHPNLFSENMVDQDSVPEW